MDNWLQKITDWFLELAKAVLDVLYQLISDTVLLLLDIILVALSGLLALIPAPCCVAANSIGNVLSSMSLPPFAYYVVSNINFQAAFAVLLCGFLFLLARKGLTLFQW